MRFPSLPLILRFFLACFALIFLPACETIWTPASTMPASLEKPGNQAAGPSSTKQYVTRSEWRDGDWVVKKGATIAFRSDGLGSFSGRVYTVRPARQQEFHFQSVQYGRDGNLLFTAPAADLGYAVHARSADRDYPVDFNFGYDARHFSYIERVLFTARIRMPKDSRDTQLDQQTTRESSK